MENKNFQLTIKGAQKNLTCQRDEAILTAMERQGYAQAPVGCRKGGCGICKIRVTKGVFETGKMSVAHVPVSDKEKNISLACRTYPKSDMCFEILKPRRRVFDINSFTTNLNNDEKNLKN